VIDDVPPFITHYHLPDRAPFLNLSDLAAADLAVVLDGLATASGSARRFGPRYMSLRRATEAKLRQLFIEAGGRPVRDSPHYFVLGESGWFRGLYPVANEVRLPLAELPSKITSFTYPDSMAAMRLGGEFGLDMTEQPYHDRVFRLEELDEVIDAYGLPKPDAPASYAHHQFRPFEHYIEFQVWSDEPVAARLGDPVVHRPQSISTDG
jgi:hypothetical protein